MHTHIFMCRLSGDNLLELLLPPLGPRHQTECQAWHPLPLHAKLPHEPKWYLKYGLSIVILLGSSQGTIITTELTLK